jgi:pyrroloquinoline-quinone synthase
MNEFVRKFEAVNAAWSKEEFEQNIRAVGTERYHDKHEFHRMLHGGKLNKG